MQATPRRDGRLTMQANIAGASTWPLGVRILIVAGCYIGLARLTLWLSLPQTLAAIFWPAAGLAVVSLLVFGRACWPGVWLGAFTSALLSSLSASSGDFDIAVIAQAATVASGVALQTLLVARLAAPPKRANVSASETSPFFPLEKFPLIVPLMLGIPTVCILSATTSSAAQYWFRDLPVVALGDVWVTWWAGDILGILLALTLFIAVALLRHRALKRALQVIVPPSLTAALAISGYYWLSSNEQVIAQNKIEIAAQQLQERLTRFLALQGQAVATVADFIAASNQVTAAEFEHFSRRSIGTEGVGGLGWAPRIPPADVTGEKDAYPLRLIATSAGNTVATGSDLSADAAIVAVMEQALVSGQPAQGLNAFEGESLSLPDYDRLLLVPVYPVDFEPLTASIEARRQQLKGFAVGYLKLDNPLQSMLAGHGLQLPVAVRLSTTGETAASKGLLEHQLSSTGGRDPDWTATLEGLPGASPRLQVWSLSSRQPGHSRTIKIYLLAGTMAVHFATMLTLISVFQQLRIRQQVKTRTAQLDQANARLQRVLNSSGLNYWDWDLVNNRATRSGAWKDLFAAEFEDLDTALDNWRQRVHSEDRSQAGAALDELLAGRCDHVEVEYRLCDPAGNWRWIRSRGAVVSLSADNTPLQIAGSHTDIHQRKQLEVDLKASEQRLYTVNANLEQLVATRTQQLSENERFLRALLDALSAHIAVLDEQGIILATNESWRIFARKNRQLPDEVGQGVNYLEVCRRSGVDGGQAAALIEEIVQGRRTEGSFEYPCHSTEQQRWFLCRITRFRGGGPVRVVLAHENITHRKLAEEAVRQLNEELEQRVVARTEQLHQAQLEAEEASRAKSTFLATMSHEIRTPLNGVVGMVEVLEQTRLNSHQLEMVELIRSSALSLLDIIDDILDLSKIEAGNFELEQAPFVVAEVVEKCCAMLDAQASNKGVELRMFADPRLLTSVLGDELRLRQILLNLTSNAIKFSSERQPGRVAVRAMVDAQSETLLRVRLEVSDNGIGMDKQAQEGLFTAFKQADASNTRRFGGTGLGLVISQHLANMMDADIQVQSAPDQGSVFTVTLPLNQVTDAAASERPYVQLAGVNCLVIGSPTSLADDVFAYLSHDGAKVSRVTDIRQATEWMSGQRPGQYVWVTDIESKAATFSDHCRFSERGGEQQLQYVLIERGQRRCPRRVSADCVTVDGNVLARSALLTAVTLASGRQPASVPLSPVAEHKIMTHPPTRVEALQQGRLILVAEDNEANQKVISHQLALLGFAADIATDGRQALSLWRSGDYALLLTDLQMPGMDGYQLTTAIREQSKPGRKTPIIALTANALKGEAERCLEFGMDGYLSKPVRLEKLRALLEQWMLSDTLAQQAVAGTDESTRTTSVANGPVDVAVLAALIGNEAEVINSFMSDFHQYGRKISDQLLSAYRQGDIGTLVSCAHKLKSSANAVGAIKLAQYCADLEAVSATEKTDEITDLITGFSAEMELVAEYIASKSWAKSACFLES